MKFFQWGILIFSIVLCISALAQTTVCSGDSIVLILNGHKQGNTTWEQSSDQTTWSAAQGTFYNDSLVIIATNTLFYQAIVTDGTCTFYSDTVMVVVRPVPPPPVAKPASNVTLLSFDANWSASAGATKYYLDVATDSGFTSFVPGYEKLKVNNKTTYSVIGISCDTTYYYRVRVYDDSCGTVNSNTISVTTPACPDECTYKSTCSGNIIDTRDNNKIYKTIQIGTQCWMAQNLNVGATIQSVLPQTDNNTIEKYCWLDTDAKCDTFGGLYLWGEMMDYVTSVSGNGKGPQGICPTGWHLPTDNEWTCLEKTSGGDTIAGGPLKATTHWMAPNTGATNKTGFTALPGEHRSVGFTNLESYCGFWWTATESDAADAWYSTMAYFNDDMYRYADLKAQYGLSVRCVKN